MNPFMIVLWLQTSAPEILPADGFDLSKFITGITVALVPVLIWATKKAVTFLPSWVLPVLAPILGLVIDIANHAVTGGSVGPMWAAILGAAGVWLREVVDQAKKAAAPKV